MLYCSPCSNTAAGGGRAVNTVRGRGGRGGGRGQGRGAALRAAAALSATSPRYI